LVPELLGAGRDRRLAPVSGQLPERKGLDEPFRDPDRDETVAFEQSRRWEMNQHLEHGERYAV
jgi:hypothetical protein